MQFYEIKNMMSEAEIKKIKTWCRNRKLKCSINEDGSVDIVGNVNIQKTKDGEFPFRFRRVTGNFIFHQPKPVLKTLKGGPTFVSGDYDCSGNKLASLQGAPTEVGGSFICSYNNLTSLEGAPIAVGGSYDCTGNNLVTLKGCPKEVHGSFVCTNNNLTILEGGPSHVDENFECEWNHLTSLQGAPNFVGGSFKCGRNSLTTLQGAPRSVGGNFYCWHNNLTSLEGGPTSVSGDYECDGTNHLTSLQGAPTYVGGNFKCNSYFMTSLKGLENTSIEGELALGKSTISFDIVPKKVKEVKVEVTIVKPSGRYADYHKVILMDKMDLDRGHYVVTPQVKTLGILNRNTVNISGAPQTIDIFHLPVRIDIQGTVPPNIEVIKSSSIINYEVHVPKGQVEIYSKHEQWKRAFLITDDNGTIVFNNEKNIAIYEDYIAKKAKAEEEKKQIEMQDASNEALCSKYLAAYQPKFELECDDTYKVKVTLNSGKKLTLKVGRKKCPFTVWQELSKYVEMLDNLQSEDQTIPCEISLKYMY